MILIIQNILFYLLGIRFLSFLLIFMSQLSGYLSHARQDLVKTLLLFSFITCRFQTIGTSSPLNAKRKDYNLYFLSVVHLLTAVILYAVSFPKVNRDIIPAVRRRLTAVITRSFFQHPDESSLQPVWLIFHISWLWLGTLSLTTSIFPLRNAECNPDQA